MILYQELTSHSELCLSWIHLRYRSTIVHVSLVPWRTFRGPWFPNWRCGKTQGGKQEGACAPCQTGGCMWKKRTKLKCHVTITDTLHHPPKSVITCDLDASIFCLIEDSKRQAQQVVMELDDWVSKKVLRLALLLDSVGDQDNLRKREPGVDLRWIKTWWLNCHKRPAPS